MWNSHIKGKIFSTMQDFYQVYNRSLEQTSIFMDNFMAVSVLFAEPKGMKEFRYISQSRITVNYVSEANISPFDWELTTKFVYDFNEVIYT